MTAMWLELRSSWADEALTQGEHGLVGARLDPAPKHSCSSE